MSVNVPVRLRNELYPAYAQNHFVWPGWDNYPHVPRPFTWVVGGSTTPGSEHPWRNNEGALLHYPNFDTGSLGVPGYSYYQGASHDPNGWGLSPATVGGSTLVTATLTGPDMPDFGTFLAEWFGQGNSGPVAGSYPTLIVGAGYALGNPYPDCWIGHTGQISASADLRFPNEIGQLRTFGVRVTNVQLLTPFTFTTAEPFSSVTITMHWGDGSTSTLTEGAWLNHTYASPGTYTYYVSVVDNFGRGYYHGGQLTVSNAPPVAVIAYEGEDLEYTFNGAGSTDPDGTVVAWGWEIRDGIGGPTLDALVGSEVDYEFPDDGEYQIILAVTDNDGAQDTQSLEIAVEGARLIGTAHEGLSGGHYSAVQSGQHVQVYRFRAGSSGRNTLYTLSNHADPSLFQVPGTVDLILCARDRADDVWKLYLSTDRGQTFTFLVNTPFNKANYKSVRSRETEFGGAIAVAVKRNTTPAQVYFSISFNLVQWKTPVLISSIPNNGDGSTPSTAVDVCQEHAAGYARIRATNGEFWHYGSEDYGVNGSWTAL